MLLDFLEEVVWSKDLLDVGVFVVGFISGVLVVHLFCSDRSPLFYCNKGLVKDFFCVNLYKSSIAVIGDTTAVVAL